MSREEFLFKMYFEYGKVPELVGKYIDNELKDYSQIDREELVIKIESNN